VTLKIREKLQYYRTFIVGNYPPYTMTNGAGDNNDLIMIVVRQVTNVSMYWYPGAATSSARLYYEGPFGGGEAKLPEYREIGGADVTIPVGFAM
jgi:hypothetical protein